MSTWLLPLALCSMALACGPLLDRCARLSLGISQADWRPRGLALGCIAAGGCLVAWVATYRTGGAWSPWLAAFVFLALVGSCISRADVIAHRIPDALTAAAFLGGAVLIVAGAVLAADLSVLVRVVLCALASFGVFFAIALVAPSAMGMGDVKLAPTIGMYLGVLGWTDLVSGLFAAFFLAGLAAAGLLIARSVHAVGSSRASATRAALKTALPFGPFLLAGVGSALLLA